MKFNIPTVLLVGYLCRLLIFGASIGDAISLAALAGLFGFIHFLEYKKEPEINVIVKADLELMHKEVADLKASVNTFKLGTQLRNRQ